MTESALPGGTGTSDEELLTADGLPSVAASLYAGVVRWDLLHPFPEQDPDDRDLGDAKVAEVGALLRDRIDPLAVEAARRLPDGLLDELKAAGLTKLGAPAELGGHGLSPFNVFRVLTAALSWSTAIGPVLTADNGLGIGAYLPALPPGPLLDWARARVAAGVVSCTADTEPIGAHNKARATTAVPAGDGEAYLITGEKIFVANASAADVIVTTATVREPDGDQLRLFFVDARSPGVRVTATHDFVGMAGFPNGSLRYERVRVPRERMLVEARHDGRLTPATTRMVVRGRMYHVAAPSLAFATAAVHCARNFVNRRRIDGRPLATYQEIQHRLADSLADTFAIASVAEWSLLADRQGTVNPLYEQLAAKNITSVGCWRTVDRTMSLLGAEALETAASKLRRGADALPMERVFRDARILRITGGVDFQLDNWAGRHVLAGHYAPNGHREKSADLAALPGLQLSPRNGEHARRVEAGAARLAETCRAIVRRHPDLAALAGRERLTVLLSRIANDLLTMSVVLMRASRLTARGRPAAQDLADVYCAAAGRRLDGWWRQLDAEVAGDAAPDHAAVADRWLRGETGAMETDIVPPGTPWLPRSAQGAR